MKRRMWVFQTASKPLWLQKKYLKNVRNEFFSSVRPHFSTPTCTMYLQLVITPVIIRFLDKSPQLWYTAERQRQTNYIQAPSVYNLHFSRHTHRSGGRRSAHTNSFSWEKHFLNEKAKPIKITDLWAAAGTARLDEKITNWKRWEVLSRLLTTWQVWVLFRMNSELRANEKI